MRVQLMTDGGADIPERLRNTLDVTVVPLYLHFQEQQYKTGVTIDAETFHRKLNETGELPRSSAPSPNDFYEAYKQADPDIPIIMLSMTKGLSSTFENAVTARNMLLEEEPAREIAVINTKTASCGIALLLAETKAKLEEGYTYQGLVDHLHERVEQTTTLFVLKSLENLILGGRLDKVKGTIAKTLNIKLLLQASDEGTIEVAEKVRGNKKALRRFVEQIGEWTTNTKDKIIVMSHCNAEDRAERVLEAIKNNYAFKEAYLTEMGPLISTYAGEGGLVISFFKDKQ
ncbi:DegV family protein [Lentibacillus lipolyticus]|nr:DegV family protein [Lentibacillus lipolyticus]